MVTDDGADVADGDASGDGDTGGHHGNDSANEGAGGAGDSALVPLQFLCLRNIRTFLTACADKFGLPKHRLFGAFDLFDVQDFGKVGPRCPGDTWEGTVAVQPPPPPHIPCLSPGD